MPAPLRLHPNRLDADEPSLVARDRVWVERIRTGDVAAFEAMFRAYKNDLGAFVESYLRSHSAAEDVLQNLFLRIWVQRELWEVPGPLRTYLFRAARNCALNYLRHERTDAAFRARVAQGAMGATGTPDPVRRPSPDETVLAHALQDAIDRAVTALPSRCQEVFRCTRYYHLSYAEAAAVLDISVKTVEVHMGRALAALRLHLAGWRV